MNRVLYQLSYAAMKLLLQTAFLLYAEEAILSREISGIFSYFFGNHFPEVIRLEIYKKCTPFSRVWIFVKFSGEI